MNLATRIKSKSETDAGSGCWLWRAGSRGSTGYGCLSVNNRTESAHRASWIAFRGPIPAGKFVCHRCDNRLCVNPDHLFLGDHDENMADMRAKGRSASPRGEKQGAHKLSELDVRAILAEPSPLSRVRSCELAAKYGIGRTYIYDIRAGISWGHISGKQSPRPVRPGRL